MDPRIRIHPKMSWIRNTDQNVTDPEDRLLPTAKPDRAMWGQQFRYNAGQC
jgi:hypothetical protein